MLRLKLQAGGEVNIISTKISAFVSNENGSTVLLDNLVAYEVNESCQSIRGMMKKLSFDSV